MYHCASQKPGLPLIVGGGGSRIFIIFIDHTSGSIEQTRVNIQIEEKNTKNTEYKHTGHKSCNLQFDAFAN